MRFVLWHCLLKHELGFGSVHIWIPYRTNNAAVNSSQAHYCLIWVLYTEYEFLLRQIGVSLTNIIEVQYKKKKNP